VLSGIGGPGWKAEWWNTSEEVQEEEGEDSGVGMVKVRAMWWGGPGEGESWKRGGVAWPW
jgi:hypothetical protein